MLIIGKVAPLEKPWVHEYSGHIELTPWKFAKPVGAVLVAIVIGIYIGFADGSVIGTVHISEKIIAAAFMLCAFFAIYKFTKDAKVKEDSNSLNDDQEAETPA